MKKKVQKKNKNNIKKFFNNPHILFAVMSLIMLFLIGYTRYIVTSHVVYTYEGESNNVSIFDGMIDLNHDVNYFVSGKIIYSGENKKLKSYEMGHFRCNINVEVPLASVANLVEKGQIDLNSIVTYSLFSFTEANSGGNIFTKKNVKNINNLCFILNGKDANDKDINIKVKLDINKLQS